MPSVENILWMVTENKHKHEEARAILASHGILVLREKLTKVEIQSQDLTEIALQAIRLLPENKRKNRTLIVEDSGLFIDALSGFPGPYSSYVHKTIGLQGVLKVLGGMNRRTARFESAVALSIPGLPPRVFVGRMLGTIAWEAKGESGFGFDPVFIPKGEEHTLAEIGAEYKNSYSHRAIALKKIAAWLRHTNRGV